MVPAGARHRLSRSGDRQLNSVLHTIAVVQIRMPKSPGHAYYQRKLSEGKTPKEAKRCLKRRPADHVWRVMIADERRAKSLPGQSAPRVRQRSRTVPRWVESSWFSRQGGAAGAAMVLSIRHRLSAPPRLGRGRVSPP
ncbi:transposase [Streptomyces sp. NPDC001984]|uniref:transposase n=1 Tax=Streptomyces sp. NPDC002619 TaxID=3364655 RepID=UPI0036BBD5F7